MLSADQSTPVSGARAEDLAAGRNHGNGIRIHGTYIVFVSIAALILMLIGIAITSAMM